MPSLVGLFLVARPTLLDPNFVRSVVLLLQHNEEGAFGLVVNRPVKAKELPFPVYVGGPCKMDGMILLHGHEDWMADEKTGQVCDGVFIGDAESAEKVTDPPPGESFRFKMFSSYAGWGPQQLEGELAERAWAIVPATGAHVFDTPVEELWTKLLPPSIPEPSVN
ncbi:MAG: YqgE/AlgH family protein [Gemmataceae bacterium]|nr:YqgE/AlgH family protein [Gemmataceae bacterium]MCI0742359.1 YqgE/AlgH family protein [Gemmataceae bacterium]